MSWPVPALLLIVVLLPTAGVLWFMGQAMGNEQLAVRQKLSDAYRAQLVVIRQDLGRVWRARLAALEVSAPASYDTGGTLFAQRVRSGFADSVVVLDTSGQPVYPAPPLIEAMSVLPSGSWRRAERLEQSGDVTAAAEAYGAIANDTDDVDVAARAWRARARSLVRDQRVAEALDVLTDTLGHARYRGAVDGQGRLLAPSAQLRALQLMDLTTDPAHAHILAALMVRLGDYGPPALPAAQRRFLMGQVARLADRQVDGVQVAPPVFDTLPAEQLAARYLDASPPAPSSTTLQPSGLPGLWHLATPTGAVVALFEDARLQDDLTAVLAGQTLPDNTSVLLLAPGTELAPSFEVSVPAGGLLAEWRLVLRPGDQERFATAARQRVKAYWVIGGLVVVVMVLIASGVARLISRQMRLTRLENDLLATVSHELKTPLSSMRLLVDTLRETGVEDTHRTDEYLALIGQENERLSRLVDNFLTFSRLRNGRQTFGLELIAVETLIEDAANVIAGRFRAVDCHFEVEVAPDLPDVRGDHDALLAVLLNLLDNAEKYSDREKRVILRGYESQEQVCLAVQDRGMGMSSRAAGKVFDRFYQVDQRLARPGSGCGLGLSIVRLIVQGHGGTVTVESRVGEGSTFTVRLPAMPRESTNPTETMSKETMSRENEDA